MIDHQVANEIADSLSLIAFRMHSPNVSDSNGEPANLVDVGSDIASGLFAIAKAINLVADAKLTSPADMNRSTYTAKTYGSSR